MVFNARGTNIPSPKYAVWWLTQFRRWGMVDGAPDYQGIASKVMRFDLYAEALKELGVDPGSPSETPETLFDGITFDPKDPEKYATSFAVHSMKA
jgi:nitrate/nitrite transport system substrate-binding protein